jgi:hypothetical protein
VGLSSQEVSFIGCLAAYVRYKQEVGVPTVKFVGRFIAEAMLDRDGLTIYQPQLERLKSKFISRPGKPASVIELAVQLKTGSPGIPSELLPTGILQFIRPSEAA